MQIKELVRENRDYVISLRRHFHQYPELSMEEYETSKKIKEELDKMGIEYRSAANTGIIATIKGDKPGKTIALRADMDALPMEETPNCEFAATNGAMHSCGHDMHTAMLLGAAKLLKQNQDQIEGTVKLVFQPDEEGFTGAKKMIKAGVLENPKVDAAMAMHVNSGTPSNLVVCGLGTSIGGCNRFRIVVKGTGCHGAMPETGVDPIFIANQIYSAIQEITNREIVATQPVVITIGKFVGGDAPNIIPGEVIMEGTIRTLDKEVGEYVFKRMGEIVSATAKMLRGEAELIELSSVPPLANNKDLATEVTGYVKDIVGEQGVFLFEGGGMGSEDFASYSYEVPSLYLILGAGAKNENPLYGEPMHNTKVVFNEDVLVTGAAIHTYSAITWLKNHK